MFSRTVCNAFRFTFLNTARVSTTNSRSIKRWVAPTLKELYRRQKKVGPVKPDPRSSYLEWNFNAELYAFGKRLGEEFDQNLLKQAFTQPCFKPETAEENVENNRDLVAKGELLIQSSLDEYFAKLQKDVAKALKGYLSTEEMLAHVAKYMGVQELIRSSEYPPSQASFCHTMKSIVALLPPERVANFVKDFLICQLNGKEICDIWEPPQPYNYLETLVKEKGMDEIEPRLCNQSASNTILANYRVGLYSNRKLLGLGWGESVAIAKETAALDAIKRMYGFKSVELI